MGFNEFYYDDFSVGNVILGKDKTLYIIKNVNDDGTFTVVDKDTKNRTEIFDKNDISAYQPDLFGDKISTDKPEVKKYKKPKTFGKPEDVDQQSLF
jgi:hypothetical protein